MVMEPLKVIEWESIDGLSNRGRVDFSTSTSTSASTHVQLTISYDIPEAVANVLEKVCVFLQTLLSIISLIIVNILERFNSVVR